MSFRAALLAVLAALVLAFPSGLLGKTRFFCRAMDRVVDTCCCASSSTPAARCGAEIGPADCCRALRSEAGDASTATRHAPDAPGVALLATLSIAEWLLLPALAASGDPGSSDAPLRGGAGPPLYLSNCVLLT